MTNLFESWSAGLLQDKATAFIPAIVTPLTPARKLDEESLKSLIAVMFAGGCKGLYVAGNTGEGMALDDDTRMRLTEVCVAEAKKSSQEPSKTPAVIVHVGHARVEAALAMARHASSVGAHAVSSMPPFAGSSKNFTNIKQFYEKLAEAASPTPVIAYHIPGVTGVNLSSSQLCELLEIPGVVGYKYTDNDLYKMECVLAAKPEAFMLHGMSTIQVAALQYGARGGITGGGGNLAPNVMCDLHSAYAAGNLEDAMRLQKKFNRIQEKLYGPFTKKMVHSFKVFLHSKGHIACHNMAQDEELSTEEVASFLDMLGTLE
eukprot:m.272527 g.272527  ORF g.272527 m.272527 type:complete len:317 (+) comp16274_c0_seq1:150-1100(+)